MSELTLKYLLIDHVGKMVFDVMQRDPLYDNALITLGQVRISPDEIKKIYKEREKK